MPNFAVWASLVFKRIKWRRSLLINKNNGTFLAASLCFRNLLSRVLLSPGRYNLSTNTSVPCRVPIANLTLHCTYIVRKVYSIIHTIGVRVWLQATSKSPSSMIPANEKIGRGLIHTHLCRRKEFKIQIFILKHTWYSSTKHYHTRLHRVFHEFVFYFHAALVFGSEMHKVACMHLSYTHCVTDDSIHTDLTIPDTFWITELIARRVERM